MPAPPDSSAARLHRSLGGLLAFWGWQGGAIQAYRDALRADPRSSVNHRGLGEALADQGHWNAATAELQEAARLDPTDLDAQGAAVVCLCRAARFSEAVEALARLANLRPGRAELHLLRACLLKRAGRPGEAIRTFRWAAELTLSEGCSRFVLAEQILGEREWRGVIERHGAARELLAIRAAAAASPAPRPGRGSRWRHLFDDALHGVTAWLVALGRRVGLAIPAAPSRAPRVPQAALRPSRLAPLATLSPRDADGRDGGVVDPALPRAPAHPPVGHRSRRRSA